MIPPIKAFVSGLSKNELSNLFDLYPVPDLEEGVGFYEARRDSNDPVVTAH